jgi:hypothetical protein
LCKRQWRLPSTRSKNNSQESRISF